MRFKFKIIYYWFKILSLPRFNSRKVIERHQAKKLENFARNVLSKSNYYKRFIQNGKLRPIAVSTLNRWPAQPEIPALSETISGFDVESWFAFVTPKSTPSNIVNKLNTEINKLLNDQLVRKSFDALGIAVAGGGADDVDKRMRSEIDRWTQLIRDSKIQIDQ
jgi:tripartite-type tricarboxylate transporter receptor subunit TctC